MIGDDGDAPDHEQNGRELVSAAQKARAAYGTEMSPADREAVLRSIPPILDDSEITPPSRPHQTAERVTSRSLSSFDL